MNVFLPGGTGFIGQALVARIRRRGWDLTVLVRDTESEVAKWIAKQGAILVRGDVTTPDGLTAKLVGSDVLIHNAGIYEFGVESAALARMNAVNVQGTENVLVGALFALWGRKTGCRTPRWYLPRGFMWPPIALMEPIQRALGLPDFLSRDPVDVSRAHLNYYPAKVQRDLGWTHPDKESMWDQSPIASASSCLPAKASSTNSDISRSLMCTEA